jgi:uncharacterized membrane protein
MSMLRLIGVAIVALGFALRLNPLLVVLLAGLATGLVAHMGVLAVVSDFGRIFVESRYLLLPVALIVPMVGVLERHGLQERAEVLIRRARGATAGRIIFAYGVVRQVAIAFGITLGGQAAAVRPLIAPMAEAAARSRRADLPEGLLERIRAHAAAADNVGAFFGEDIFVAVGAVLLMKGFFDSLHLEVGIWSMALWGLPTAVCGSAALFWRMQVLDRKIEG